MMWIWLADLCFVRLAFSSYSSDSFGLNWNSYTKQSWKLKQCKNIKMKTLNINKVNVHFSVLTDYQLTTKHVHFSHW